MLIKVDGGTTPVPSANEHKDGTDYDVCPVDGGAEIAPVHRIGYGHAPNGEEYMDGAIYSSDLRDGGCGHTWGRKTRQGVERDHVHAPDSGSVTLTGSARKTVILSPNSEAYQTNYERIFGHP